MARRSRKKHGWLGAFALLFIFAALALAAIPEVEREKESVVERWTGDFQRAMGIVERQAFNEGKFEFSLEGDALWTSLAMAVAIAGVVLGILAFGSDILSGIFAVLLGIALIGWLYLTAV